MEDRAPDTEGRVVAWTPEPGDLIEFEWSDSEQVDLGWASAEDYIEALNDRRTYRTAGYFIAETEAGVMVSHSRSEDNGTFNAAMVIPTAVVTGRIRLIRPMDVWLPPKRKRG